MLGRGTLEAGVVVMIDDDNIFIMVETKPQIRKSLSVTSWSVLDIHSVCIILVHFFELQIYFFIFLGRSIWISVTQVLNKVHSCSCETLNQEKQVIPFKIQIFFETLNISGTPWFLILSTSKCLSELTFVCKLYFPNYSLTILCWNIF